MTGRRERVLNEISHAYLSSRDFNGLPLAHLLGTVGLDWSVLRTNVIELVDQGLIGVQFPDRTDNPHILRFKFEPVDVQVDKLGRANDLDHTCVYPRRAHLCDVIDPTAFAGQPYRLELALGEPQLSYRSFDLSVLEAYRNDPRYVYHNTDIGGSISIRDEFFQSSRMMQRDKVLLQTFGFAYDAELNRAVAVFLRYLSDLSPEHQQIWRARELPGKYTLHPDYYKNTILGEWGERESIFKALLVELHIINLMAEAMGRPPLFRKDFGPYAENKPRQLSFLVRPTLDEFNNFILLLDKLLSDNINKDFFATDVKTEIEQERSDGKVIVRPQGTLIMLNEWIRKKIRLDDWEPWGAAMTALREVRKLRQKPAHAVDDNEFDQKYFRQQRELVIRTYSAVRTLRLLLTNHPAAKTVQVPEWLYAGLIWDF